jgi:hypothetical protein
MTGLAHDVCRCKGYACDRKTECARYRDRNFGHKTPWTARLCPMGRESEYFIAAAPVAEEVGK